MTDSLSGLQAVLALPAAEARDRFDGHRNGYLEGSSSVHGVRLQAWFGLQVPAPGCHVGVGSWDFTRFKPTNEAVTCGRCLRAKAKWSTPLLDDPGQLTLDLDQA